MLMGRLSEARREMTQALKLDPLSKQSMSALAYICYYARDLDGALRECRRAIARDPTYFEVYGCLGLTQIARGDLEGGIEAFREADRLTGGMFPLAHAFLCYALGLAGKAAEARELLAGLEAARAERYVPPVYLAVAHIGLGEIERALSALDDAYVAKDGTILFLRILPVFEPLRGDGRFENLCRVLALTDPAGVALDSEHAETRSAPSVGRS
jgi:tetratricopeptide (TPR) repeat protein